MMMLKQTTRYRLNKLISQTPEQHIQYVLDVDADALPAITDKLSYLTMKNSVTLVVISNRSKRGVL